jgi:hypothetical protein
VLPLFTTRHAFDMLSERLGHVAAFINEPIHLSFGGQVITLITPPSICLPSRPRLVGLSLACATAGDAIGRGKN